ncbi:bifunctional N(6)-L-threonylcarbamoyladenine synthase/serine/threonine protein kinase [Halanaeroarchaeum sulfurireducens]|uniref:Probable bifunctional tRNA threonylcarbamoyladenosine biosynthesis protein n=1 Tax=Halanaeroarchaeum sulfurireducens TaxID=1604004 RepID=A0A0N9N577_9EURY|nr:bifunctional N(6)-L-threonylcarbamoyladenine synthase/serine/threonine protein kinase [Halanaeroarchaeum sulfurireducens]ALG82841.1 bifunctional UGMP family protein/serine/threonine protein kinase [Halanaeroarchaeum sulfurireducens]
MRVLGIEGTAWAASAAVYDNETDDVFIETDPYQPESGGIHPREAAEHMREAIPSVVETALSAATGPIDAVAFSRGPGLGPCLRVVGTAARALAQSLDVSLVGVNHMVAHLEIGRHRSGFDSPVCLNVSGANAHVLGYRNGRYRVLGETMDTGAGNAIDKFTRHVGWTHPGGPKVEEAANDGEYVDLPYVVKGMDFSFSGIMSAAKQAYDDGVPVEDVSRGLQETMFAMLTEVSERALSLTGRDELVVGGGVAQNERLQEMLREMADQRGANLHVPDPRFLGDNAGMIAVLGAMMAAAGETVAVEDSGIDADYRPDQVPVTWRPGEPPAPGGDRSDEIRGAEAVVTVEDGLVTKRRVPKTYRHPALDERLRRERTVEEARLTHDARRAGVPTPVLRDVDVRESTLVVEFVGERDLRDAVGTTRVQSVGEHLATIHGEGIVSGDPTTRNVRVDGPRTYLIDFGLGYYSQDVEDHAMDLHVFEQSLRGTADEPEPLVSAFEGAYADAGQDAVLDQLRAIEGRGRYQ